MKTSIPLTLLLMAGLLVSGCQQMATRSDVQAGVSPAQAEPEPVKLPFAEPTDIAQELDEDLVYSYLVGEIGTRTGNLREALIQFLHAAMLARDPYAAERASRIAIHLKDYERGLRAVRRWVELAPNSITARQLGGLLFLRNGQSELALEQFRAAVAIAQAKGKDGMLQAATALSSEPDAGAALGVMQALVSEHADDPRAQYAMAIVETRQKRYLEAETSLRRAIELDPSWSQPRILLSRVLVELGRNEQGLRHLAGALQEYPEDQAMRLSYARLLVSEGQYDNALEQFRILHRQDTENLEVSYALAMLATQQEQWSEARGLWQELRNEERYRDEATYFLGQVEEVTDNTVLAIGLYKAVGSEELKPDAVIRMSRLMGQSGQLAEAREALRQARVAYSDRSVDLYLAEIQLLRESDAERSLVEQVYRSAIAAHPEELDLPYNRGLYYAAIGEYALMEADFDSVLERDPDNAEALNALGYTLADLNQRLDEAYSYILRALKLKPDNRAIQDSLGWVYYRMGDFANAIKHLRQANEGEADDEIAAHLGEVLWVSGSTDEAEEVWREALQEVPQSEHLRAIMERFISN